MTTEQKIIRAKIGLLELAKQLGNVSQACKMMGYSRDSFYRFKELVSSSNLSTSHGLARWRMSSTQKPRLRSRPSLMPTVQSGSLNSVFSVAVRSQ